MKLTGLRSLVARFGLLCLAASRWNLKATLELPEGWGIGRQLEYRSEHYELVGVVESESRDDEESWLLLYRYYLLKKVGAGVGEHGLKAPTHVLRVLLNPDIHTGMTTEILYRLVDAGVGGGRNRAGSISELFCNAKQRRERECKRSVSFTLHFDGQDREVWLTSGRVGCHGSTQTFFGDHDGDGVVEDGEIVQRKSLVLEASRTLGETNEYGRTEREYILATLSLEGNRTLVYVGRRVSVADFRPVGAKSGTAQVLVARRIPGASTKIA